jgi:hypothetical protein
MCPAKFAAHTYVSEPDVKVMGDTVTLQHTPVHFSIGTCTTRKTHTFVFTNAVHLLARTFSPFGRRTTLPSMRRSNVATTASGAPHRMRSVRGPVPEDLSLYSGPSSEMKVVFRTESAESARAVHAEEPGATSVSCESFAKACASARGESVERTDIVSGRERAMGGVQEALARRSEIVMVGALRPRTACAATEPGAAAPHSLRSHRALRSSVST